MLTMHASRAVTKCKSNRETNVLREPSTCNILHINLLINGNHHNQGFYISTSPWKCGGQIKGSSPSNISNLATLKRRLIHVSASSDDEYRSSRNIAVSLFRRYRNVIERGGGDNLKEFISAGVNAYALGCTDEGLRKELIDMRESGVEIEAMQTYGGNTGLKSKIFSEEMLQRAGVDSVNSCYLSYV